LSSCPFSLSVLVISEETLTEKPSKFKFPKSHIPDIHRPLSTASHRHSTSIIGTPQKIILNPSRNVTTGIIANVPESVKNILGFIKQGMNIIDRIGEPDHTGWMRKRGDRYNTWKRRYFILKGQHLYFLRSDNIVGCAPLYF
jgi:hypothetical protein